MKIYKNCFKRLLDILCSLSAILVFSWLYILLIVFGTFAMMGNPFFTQLRPGKDEKIFKLIKFRTMNNKKDAKGELLPDNERLNGYGRFLRKTSLDELPEAFNILKGDMSVVGPRPLLVKYLPLYNDEQRHRHDVRPGLSGLAQISGRNGLSWEEKFEYDVEYAKNVSFKLDLKIVALTVWKAFVKGEGINQEGEATMKEFAGTPAE